MAKCNEAPKAGDVFVCCDCGMTLVTIKGCCGDSPCLECCGKDMQLANPSK